MRNLLILLLSFWLYSNGVFAANESLAKLTAEGLCKEYGYRRDSPDFDKCQDNVMRAAASRGGLHEPIGKLYTTSGEVQITAEGHAAQFAAKGALLENNMNIATGKQSWAVLKFLDGQIVVLQENSSFQIHDYRYNPKDIKQSDLFFSLLSGGMRSINGLIGDKHPSAFRLESPGGTLSVRNSDFMLIVANQIYSQVRSGVLQMDNAAGTKVSVLGETTAVAGENSLPVTINPGELPAELFVKLSSIPIPEPTPMVIELVKPLAPVLASTQIVSASIVAAPREKSASEKLCEGYGYISGSEQYKQCVESATQAPANIVVAEDFVGKVENATGEVEIAVGDSKLSTAEQKKKAVGKGARLKKHMSVTTGEKSLAVLKFQDGQIIALAPNSTFKIKDYRFDPNDEKKCNVAFSMLKGGARLISGSIARTRPEAFKMSTLDTTIRVHGSDFMLITDDQTYMQVSSGTISMGNKAGTTELDVGHTAVTASETTLPVILGTLEVPPEVNTQFEVLSTIPLPSANPLEKDFAQALSEVGQVQEKSKGESFCENYGYAKGSAEYNICMTTAGENGFKGDAEKHQNAGEMNFQIPVQEDTTKKKRRLE